MLLLHAYNSSQFIFCIALLLGYKTHFSDLCCFIGSTIPEDIRHHPQYDYCDLDMTVAYYSVSLCCSLDPNRYRLRILTDSVNCIVPTDPSPFEDTYFLPFQQYPQTLYTSCF